MENSQSAISLESQDGSPSRIGLTSSRLEAIAKVLNVETSVFLDRKARRDDPGRVFATAEGRALVEAYERIEDPDQRRRILALVTLLAEGGSS